MSHVKVKGLSMETSLTHVCPSHDLRLLSSFDHRLFFKADAFVHAV